MENLLDPKYIAELLCVTTDDLKNWRRLPVDHDGRLASTRIDGRHYYQPDVVVEFLVRNPKRLAVAKFYLEEARLRQQAVADARLLRGYVPTDPMPVESSLWDKWA